MNKVIAFLLLLFLCSQAEIIHQTIIVRREEALDIDKGETFECFFGMGDLSTAEFAYHGDGLEWMNSDMRIYTFLRQSHLVKLPFSELNTQLNTNDKSIFCKTSDKTPMIPVDSGKYEGGDTSGITLSSHQDSLHLGIEDIATNQIFIMKTSEGKMALARIKKFYISHT